MLFADEPSTATWAAIAIAAYGAFLSTILAWRQFWQERRRIRVVAHRLAYVQPEGEILQLLEVRAFNEGKRPVHIRQAGVITISDDVFHPTTITPFGAEKGTNRSAMLEDGQNVVFYFDPLSFEGRYAPKAVWVRDFGGRPYAKRLSRKQRQDIAEMTRVLRERLGSGIDSQLHLVRDTYRQNL